MSVIRDYLNKKFNDYDQDLETIRIGGFDLLARTAESISSSNEVVQIPLEDGSVISDHVIVNPTVITIEGNVSNVHLRGDIVQDLISDIGDNVSLINQFLPERTQTQLTKINEITSSVNNAISLADSIYDRGRDILSQFGVEFDEQDGGNIQLDFFNEMTSYRENGTLIRIGMPFKVYENMVITLMEFNTDNIDDSLNFTIEAVKVDFLRTEFSEIPVPKNPSTQDEDAVGSEKDKGSQSPIESQNQSIASEWLDDFIDSSVGRVEFEGEPVR